MSLAISWLLFPLVLGLLSLGLGLLVERAAGFTLQRELVLPVGFAAIVVVALCTTANSSTARLTTPLVVALAVAGLGLALPWRPRKVGGWAAASAAAVYAAFGAPIFLSGNATFAGYIKLDDTSTWLAFADRLLDHGRNSTGLAPSTYEATIAVNLPGGYPVGAFPPLGVVHELMGTDSAWIFQPYVAFMAAMLALAIYGLMARVVESRGLRALAAFVASQPALLYAYSLWGGVKEVAAGAVLVLVAALAPTALQAGARVRAVLPLAVATAALLGIESFFGGVWIVPILLPALVVGLRQRRLAFLLPTGAFAAFTAVLSLPTLALVGQFSNSGSTLTQAGDLGNLLHPLSVLQVLGIWPIGDFRHQPSDITLTYVLVAVVGLAGLAGIYWALRRREWALVMYVAGAAMGCGVTVAVGSPWIDGKALAIASPAALVAAMAAVGWLFRGGRRVEAVAAMLVLGGGVLWSNALAYHEVSLGPRSQLRELETIGKQFAGDSPALMNEYAPYGVRHFLRKLDAEGASELRRRPIFLRDGTELPKGASADIDQFALDAVLVYRTLVLIHSPAASRPPSVYQRVWSGQYYDVWQRPAAGAPRIIEHLPLGNGLQPAAAAAVWRRPAPRPPRCREQGAPRGGDPSAGRRHRSLPGCPSSRMAGRRRQPRRGLPLRLGHSRDLCHRPGRRALRTLDGRFVPAAALALARRPEAGHRAKPPRPPRGPDAVRRSRPHGRVAPDHALLRRRRAQSRQRRDTARVRAAARCQVPERRSRDHGAAVRSALVVRQAPRLGRGRRGIGRAARPPSERAGPRPRQPIFSASSTMIPSGPRT